MTDIKGAFLFEMYVHTEFCQALAALCNQHRVLPGGKISRPWT